jgi:hypothetical protein
MEEGPDEGGGDQRDEEEIESRGEQRPGAFRRKHAPSIRATGWSSGRAG